MEPDFRFDFGLVKARLANLDKAIGNEANKKWRETGKAAAEVIRAEWERRAPRKTGAFIRGGTVGFDRRGGYVNVTDSTKAPPWAPVVEFGGTIPVPHSRTNAKLAGLRRMASTKKPWIGGRGGTSYYLYPAKDDKLQEAANVYMAGVQKIVDDYLPRLRRLHHVKLHAVDIEAMTLGDIEFYEVESGSSLSELSEGRVTTKGIMTLIVMQERKTNPAFTMDDARALRMSDIEFENPPEAKQSEDHKDPTAPAVKRAPKPTS